MKVSSVTFEMGDGDEFVVYLNGRSNTVILERHGKTQNIGDNKVAAAHALATMQFKDDDDLQDLVGEGKRAIIEEYEGQILTILEQMR